MIECCGVSHAFDSAPVLRNVNLRLGERRIGVIGANGSGKSTFARLLNGLLVPAQGEVLVDGVSTRKNGRAARRKVGLVFQNPEHQIVMPSVEEDMAFGPKNLGLDSAEIERRMQSLLGGYGLAEKRGHAAHLLSGGEKKLLTLLSVVIMEPDVIVFDEPMSSLDLPSQRKIARAIEGLRQTVITITHDLGLIENYDRAILFERGAVAADGAPGGVIRQYLANL